MAEAKLDERGLPAGYPFQAGWEVSPRDVAAMRDAGEPVLLLDVRTDKELAAARIEGATHIPMQALPGRLDELDDHLDERVVVF